MDPSAGFDEPRSPHLHRAGEPILRSLLRNVPGRRRDPPRPDGSYRRPASPIPQPGDLPAAVHDMDIVRRRGASQRGRVGGVRLRRERAGDRSARSRPSGTHLSAPVESECRRCRSATPGPRDSPTSWGTTRRSEIPNYWAYARTYGLQDQMFAPSDSWTLPSHLYLVSAGRRRVPGSIRALVVSSDLELPGNNVAGHGPDVERRPTGDPRPYIWADRSRGCLSGAGVSWAYYVGPEHASSPPCSRPCRNPAPTPMQNPLPGFRR